MSGAEFICRPTSALSVTSEPPSCCDRASAPPAITESPTSVVGGYAAAGGTVVAGAVVGGRRGRGVGLRRRGRRGGRRRCGRRGGRRGGDHHRLGLVVGRAAGGEHVRADGRTYPPHDQERQAQRPWPGAARPAPADPARARRGRSRPGRGGGSAPRSACTRSPPATPMPATCSRHLPRGLGLLARRPGGEHDHRPVDQVDAVRPPPDPHQRLGAQQRPRTREGRVRPAAAIASERRRLDEVNGSRRRRRSCSVTDIVYQTMTPRPASATTSSPPATSPAPRPQPAVGTQNSAERHAGQQPGRPRDRAK